MRKKSPAVAASTQGAARRARCNRLAGTPQAVIRLASRQAKCVGVTTDGSAQYH